jgi:hypothetical protein
MNWPQLANICRANWQEHFKLQQYLAANLMISITTRGESGHAGD